MRNSKRRRRSSKPRVAAQGLEIRIAAQPLDEPITQFERPLEGGKRRLDHSENRVTASQIVPCDGVIGNQPDQPAIDLEGTSILPFGGEIVPVNAQGIDVERVTFQNPTEKIDFELDLALLAQPPVEVSGDGRSEDESPGRFRGAAIAACSLSTIGINAQ